MDDTWSEGAGLTDADFADIMGVVAQNAAALSTEAPAAVPDPAPSSPDSSVPAVAEPPVSAEPPAATAAVPPAAETPADPPVAASPSIEPTPDPEPSPTPDPAPPVWDSPENPWRKQAEEARAVLQSLEQAAKQREFEQQNAEYQRERAIADELIARLPDMEPEQQAYTVNALRAWERETQAKRALAAEQQLEVLSRHVTIEGLMQTFGLQPEDRKTLEKMNDPYQMRWWAETARATRSVISQKDQELAAIRARAALQDQANARLTSGADTVSSGSGASPTRPQDADNMDDYFAALAPMLPAAFNR